MKLFAYILVIYQTLLSRATYSKYRDILRGK